MPPILVPISLSCLTFVTTYLGGLISLRYKNKLNVVLGFTAGVLIAVVAFDIIPEIVAILGKTHAPTLGPMIGLVMGFLIFHALEKTLLIHHSHEDTYGKHTHPSIGVLSAFALIGHSFLDGVGIGLAFQVSSAVGILISIAVIAHDFSDGMNTASLMLLSKNTASKTMFFVLLDGFAPILGVLSTYFFRLSEPALLIYLGFFAGFLLYIGASDILPQAHSPQPSYKPLFMTVLGIIFIFLVTRLI